MSSCWAYFRSLSQLPLVSALRWQFSFSPQMWALSASSAPARVWPKNISVELSNYFSRLKHRWSVDLPIQKHVIIVTCNSQSASACLLINNPDSVSGKNAQDWSFFKISAPQMMVKNGIVHNVWRIMTRLTPSPGSAEKRLIEKLNEPVFTFYPV